MVRVTTDPRSMEGRIATLIEEAADRNRIAPDSDPVYDRLLAALETTRQIAEEWDGEMRRAGLPTSAPQ